MKHCLIALGVLASSLSACTEKGWPSDLDTLIVEFHRDVDRSTIDAIHAEIEATVLSSSRLSNFDTVRLPPDVSLEQGITFYEGKCEVVYAIPNLDFDERSTGGATGETSDGG